MTARGLGQSPAVSRGGVGAQPRVPMSFCINKEHVDAYIYTYIYTYVYIVCVYIYICMYVCR